MSLRIYIAHTGVQLDADPTSFDNLDALRVWISQASSIPPSEQILLTTRGRHVKLPALSTEDEIFLYDRELLTPPTPSSHAPTVSPSPVPSPFSPDDPPDTLTKQNNLKAWQNLFMARREWALDVIQKCRSMAQEAERHFVERSTVERGLRIASGNHATHIRGVEQKHAAARTWFEGLSKEQEVNLQSWETDLHTLGSIPAKEGFRQFLTEQDDRPKKPSRTTVTTLGSFLDHEAIRKAVATSSTVVDEFGHHISKIGIAIQKIASDYDEFTAALDRSSSRSFSDDREEPSRLLKEIDVVVKKVSSDYEHVLDLPATSKSVAQISKMALLHTRNYLPAISDYAKEMSDLVRRAVEEKNFVVVSAGERMHMIATIESSLSTVVKEVSSLEIPADALEAFDTLGFLARLPSVYGSLLVESVRRQEWVDKMKKDSSALAEELAVYREEEEHRRRKWLKSVGDDLRTDLLEGKALGVDINLQGEEHHWPQVNRDDLQDHLKALRALHGLDAAAEEFEQSVKELDRPTKQQIKRAKGFKMGSVHEAGFGRGSLMLRGEDDLHVLRDAYAKLEEELRGSKSRVRKLEDLMHRQNQPSRQFGISGFQPQNPQFQESSTPEQRTALPSPRLLGELSRHPSVSSRRVSSNQANEEKSLTRKILDLEAQLLAEKEARASLEKEVFARKSSGEDTRRQIEEANSTKRDLMENMEAQQREFANERRSLEQELERCKLKIEEVEDEMDRILGSRDNERTGADTKMQSIVAELDQIRREAAEEVARLEERTREANRRREQAEAEQKVSLSAAYRHLSDEGEIPENFTQLTASLESLALRSANRIRDLEQSVAITRSENETLHSAVESRKAEISSLSVKLDAQDAEIYKLQEELAAEQAKVSSLSIELGEERAHLRLLRSKFAEGETGSEALRQRVAEEEGKVGRLSTQLAEAKSHVNSLDVELSALQSKYNSSQTSQEAASMRLQQRSSRAKELTQKLYAQTDRLGRLLESLGFAITHQDDTMVVQRASRASTSTILSDTAPPMNRSVSSPPLTKKSLVDLAGLGLLRWMESESSEEEAKIYADYLSAINRFNIDIFSETITKRIRDMEHTARKWQKEARAYRDKSHRAQSEAHEKIAFRSFKEGDLALFLPTRNQATRPWAAFNVGAPHYFLREQDSHKLHNKEWLVARISKVEERVVDLSKAMEAARGTSDARSIGETSDGASFDDDNPFDLSDGLRWYLLDAAEEKLGAPTTPGLSKSTVASTNVDAKGSIKMKKSSSGNDASKTLNRSLDSRRSSSNSKKGVAGTLANKTGSSEALGGDVAAESSGAGLLKHLRSGSQASSLRPTVEVHDAMEAEEEERVAMSPSKSTTAPPSKSTAPFSRSARGDSSSPTKPTPQARAGLWDSLWQLDISYESGKAKN